MHINDNSFVITGGTSLIGSRIARDLLAAGARRVVLFDNLSLGSLDHLDDLLADDRVEFVRGDIRDRQQLTDVCAGIDGIFAIAAFLTLPLSENPVLGMEVNVMGMVNTFEAARAGHVGKVVMASSISVYGDQIEGVVDEATPFGSASLSAPFALYALTKLTGEQLGRLYSSRHGVEFNAVRFSTVYGERQHRRGVNALAMVQAWAAVRHDERPELTGDGSDAHDFLYVGDAAAGAVAAMAAGRSGESYTIASGADTTSRRTVELVIAACGSDVEPVIRADDRDARPTVHSSLRLDVTKARDELDWRAEVSIEDGVRRLVSWLDENQAAA